MVKKYTKSPDKSPHPTRISAPVPKAPASSIPRGIAAVVFVIFFGASVSVATALRTFETTHEGKIYPGVFIDGLAFGEKSPEDVARYFSEKTAPFSDMKIELKFEEHVATVSGKELAVAYDGKLAGTQAYSLGRSGHILSDWYQRWRAATKGVYFTSIVTMNTAGIDEQLTSLAKAIDITPNNALFTFENGRVAAFRPSSTGRELDREQTKNTIRDRVLTLAKGPGKIPNTLSIPLAVAPKLPEVTTEKSNEYGIYELIGQGNSTFRGSIPGRVHNVALAASRIHGHLVAPGTVFSFNDALGDISAATGYQQAYIIQNGRTILGDGGGVCQVSTTLFRAALNTGLPIEERHAHSYRVGYYEQNSGPGLDATVFSPSYDLKFKNDTKNHILIQAKTDINNYSLVFELYGTKDGRTVELTKPVILSQIAPPPDLYQDDPTLPKDVVKQVDWKAWGAKVTFDYKVQKDGKQIYEKTFFTSYQPWQSVFLRGTKEG